jgi:hypothetical protein
MSFVELIDLILHIIMTLICVAQSKKIKKKKIEHIGMVKATDFT